MRLRSNGWWPWIVAGAMILTAEIGWSQQAGASPSAIEHQQPSLTVDRDPVPSPDSEAPAPKTDAAPQGLGQITRGQGGKYTLYEDA